MVDHPRLFLQALNERAEQRSSERLRDGPEGECEADLWRMTTRIKEVAEKWLQLSAMAIKENRAQ
jgi:hypothetical protein